MNTREEYLKNKHYYTIKDCPFCTKLVKNETILFETDLWIVKENDYPYNNIDKHLLVFPKRHIKKTSQINKKEWEDYYNIQQFMYNFFWNKEFFSFIRHTEGNKSVEHLHFHYLSWLPSFDIKKG